ncbi:MAG: Dabb family protein [Gemmatimonadota bacterium]
MIHHVVLFNFLPTTTEPQLDAAERGLLAMKGQIAEVLDVRFGRNLGPSADQYSHALLVVCEDMDAVRRYLDHPVHRNTVSTLIAPIRSARMAVDFVV